MNQKQIYAIRCAYADLLGALQAYEQMDMQAHDWEAHKESLDDLLEAFPHLQLDE